MREIAFIDLGIILFLLFFLARGYQQGLIRQTTALVGLILGLKIASDNYLYLSTILETQFYLHKPMANILGFAVILIVVLILVNLIGWFLNNMTKVLFLSFFDRITGAVIGLLKGGIVVYLVLLLISKVPYHQVTNELDRSVLAKDLLSLTPYIEENLDRILRP